jgi:transcriptional regulatory protein RtcR
LADVLTVIRESKTLSAAGRRLFAVSRGSRKRPNDADRLRKYLDRFGVDWRKI